MILSNQVECLNCGDTPFSTTRHDFKTCKCGSIAVDGGMEYLRRVGDITSFKEMSIEITKEQYDAAMKAINWARETKRNDLGLLCAIMRALRESNFQ